MLCAQTAKRWLIGEVAMTAGRVQWWIAQAVLIALLVTVEPMHARAQSGDQLADLRAQVSQLYGQGKYAAAVAVAERYIGLARQKHGQDHTEYAAAISWLAYVYQAQGRYAEAEPLYRRDLAITEKALGSDHPAFGQSLNNLAELYRTQGRYAEAEPLYERALAIDEKVLGPDHPDVAIDLNNLAELYHAQGRTAEAKPLLKRVLAIRERTSSK
jgi:tetratricopeptide (TPR) repeat protein